MAAKKRSSGKKWLKRVFASLIIVLVLMIVFAIGSNYYVIKHSAKNLYGSVDSIPYNNAGLVLGTSKYVKKGVPNLFYQNRMDAALALYLSGKVKYLILSGDNATMAYNEPITMKKDLVKMGIPDSVIFLDYAGFRTLDAVVRAKEIFGQSKITIVSQQFHNFRAVYLCQQFNIDAVAYNAAEVPFNLSPFTYYREYFARSKAMLDIFLGKQPKFLGEKIIVPN